jgi:hypothetical protein
MIYVSEVRAASIIVLMMEAARTSETSADIQLRTQQYIPEDSELHTRRRENLEISRKNSYFVWEYSVKKCTKDLLSRVKKDKIK